MRVLFEKKEGYDTLRVEAYKGIVDITVESNWQDVMLGMLLSYKEWDELVAAVAKERGETK